MEKKEFDERLLDITKQISLSEGFKKEYIGRIKDLYENLNLMIFNLDSRDEKFLAYLRDINELSFTDNIMTPSDIFPGIRTVAKSTNLKELEEIGERMKNDAKSIEVNESIAETAVRVALTNLASAAKALDNYATIKSDVYDKELSLLDDMKSIYNVGNLTGDNYDAEWISKNT